MLVIVIDGWSWIDLFLNFLINIPTVITKIREEIMKNPPITITAIAHGEEIIISLLSEFAWFGVTNKELVLSVCDVESKEENKFADILDNMQCWSN